jgi:hypothetical protein
MAKQVEEDATAAGAFESGTSGYSVSRDDISPGTFVSQVPGTPVSFPSFHGRPVSWVAVSLIMAAFLLGGLALVFSVWWLFWASIGLGVVGGLLALGTGIFNDWY